MPIWAAIASRMKALLLGSLLSSSANSFSTLKATTAVFGNLLDMARPPFEVTRIDTFYFMVASRIPQAAQCLT
jgi:hypothetical protein